jgi:N utilization substance protein B
VTSRKEARRSALTVLYQWDLTGQAPSSLYEGELDSYATELVDGVVASAAELDARIDDLSHDWPASRLGHVERAILRMALCELGQASVPAAVAINEAVVLARRFSGDDAAKLVNGILGRAAPVP